MIQLLDTNVISETMKPRPAAALAAWMRAQQRIN
jgi:predicted nucleic acid-binding protein